MSSRKPSDASGRKASSVKGSRRRSSEETTWDQLIIVKKGHILVTIPKGDGPGALPALSGNTSMASMSVTEQPASHSDLAAASPPQPAPMTTTDLPAVDVSLSSVAGAVDAAACDRSVRRWCAFETRDDVHRGTRACRYAACMSLTGGDVAWLRALLCDVMNVFCRHAPSCREPVEF